MRAVQLQNAPSLIVVSESGSVRVVRLVHSKNARSPTAVSVSGSVKPVSCVNFRNVHELIASSNGLALTAVKLQPANSKPPGIAVVS